MKKNFNRAGTIMLLGLLGMLSIWKIRLGLHSDEAYCIALGDMMARGNSFFKECWSSLQMSSVFTAPVIYIYERIMGNREGILLLFRFLSVCIQMCICIWFYMTFRNDYQKKYVAVASVILFTFIPDAQSFTYKQEIIWFITLEIIFSYNYFVLGRKKHLIFLGIMIACSVLAYPTAVVQFLMYIILIYISGEKMPEGKKGFWKDVLILTGACAACAIAFFLIVFRQISIAEFVEYFPKAVEDDNLNRSFITKLYPPLIKFTLLGVVTVTAILLCKRLERLITRRRGKQNIVLPIATVLLCGAFIGQVFIERRNITWHCITYPYSLTIFMMPLIYWGGIKTGIKKFTFILFEIQAIIAVFCMALASNQGNVTSMYGTVFSTVGLMLMLGDRDNLNGMIVKEKRMIMICLCIFAVGMYAGLVYEQESVTLKYNTRSVFTERILVMDGPAKGILLGEETYERYNNIRKVIESDTSSADRVYIMDDIYTAPYGYLSLKGNYATFSPQGGVAVGGDSDKAVQYFSDNFSMRPTVVLIHMEGMEMQLNDYLKESHIGDYLGCGEYELIKEEGGYAVFKNKAL